MPTPLKKQGTPPIEWSKCNGTNGYCIQIRKNHLMIQLQKSPLMTAHTHTHTHTLPIEQHTNAHNTFSEPLTAIVAHQVVEDKQKGLSPLTTDIAYIAFHYLLCWKKAKIFLSMALNASRLTSAEHVQVKVKDETPHISFHPRLLYWTKTQNVRLNWPCINASM